MTQPMDYTAYIEFQKRAFAPLIELNQLAAKTFERALRQGYEAAGEAVEFAIAQTHAAASAKDPMQFASKQTELTSDYVARQTARGNEFLKLAQSTQAEVGKWAQAANEELNAAVRKSA